MKKLGAFFKLVRWPNLLITALMMCLVYHNLTGMISTVGFTLLVIAMVFIVAGGYVINDIFDMDIDEINKPDKLIVGKFFSEKQSNFIYWSLTIIGLACALVSSVLMFGKSFLTVFSCMVLLTCILYSYSKTYKKKLVVGNLIVSLSVAFAVFLPWFFVMLFMLKENMLAENYEVLMHISLRLVLIYTVFAFLMTMMREIVKDMEDVKGDGWTHCRTIPIIWGMNASQIIVIALSFITVVMIWNAASYLSALGFKITCYMLYASGILVFFVTVNNFVSLITDKSLRTERQFRLQSMFLKISMLIGVLSMFFIK